MMGDKYQERTDSRIKYVILDGAAKKRKRGRRAGRYVQARRRRRELNVHKPAHVALYEELAAEIALISTSGRCVRRSAAIDIPKRDSAGTTATFNDTSSSSSESKNLETIEIVDLCDSDAETVIMTPPQAIDILDTSIARKVFEHHEIPDNILLDYARHPHEDPNFVPTSVWNWCEFRFETQ
ncbi:uncharacterized protein LOC114882337 [Osmia bicornis bicornis]|uniref:uncharacterized protein LOC114882337 n=1 Tax=Osmia bicornis bicornis TaxID=1437191 RepID=UPI001EAF0C39|nr:uncharacterized protein LOC114882337 [Osmia bicornis bicornis]